MNRKADFFCKTNQFESIRITNRIESIWIVNWNALLWASLSYWAYSRPTLIRVRQRVARVHRHCGMSGGRAVYGYGKWCRKYSLYDATHVLTPSQRPARIMQRKVKAAHTRLPSVGFRSWSRFLAVSLQVTRVINPSVGCHYFPPGLQLPSQPLRGLLRISLLGEQRHDGCEQFA